MTGRPNHRGWIVQESIPSADGLLCVDFFEDPNGGFGFEHFRADPEDGGRWTAVGTHGGGRYPSVGDAVAAAQDAVAWLTGEAGAAEQLARFLASSARSAAPGCVTCALVTRRDDGEAPPWDMILRTDLWDVVHAFGTSVEGWLVLVLRRHETAVADLTDDEAAQLGPLIKRVSAALHTALGCQKTYVAQFAEAAEHPHVHVHVIARHADQPSEWVGPGIFFNGMGGENEVTETRRNEIAAAVAAVL